MTALQAAEIREGGEADSITDVESAMAALGAGARAAGQVLAKASTARKNAALTAAAQHMRAHAAGILAANARDMAETRGRGATGAFLDRLELNQARVEAMANGLDDIVALPDPIGTVIGEWQRPNGLKISRMRVPLGVIGIIYESRPNVTADAGALCLKSGNAAILRGGSESFHSSRAICDSLVAGLRAADLPEGCIQLVPTRDRAAVGVMLTMTDDIDVIVPRGGKSLIQRVAAESRIPVIKHLDGICHVYIDRTADPQMAEEITVNAKMRRTGICGAAETLLVHKDAVNATLPRIVERLTVAGCAIRGDQAAQQCDPRVTPASDADWDTEYLDAILSVRVVESLDQAIDHVERHGSHHTDSIVTNDHAAAERFLSEIDSAIVLHNASTQYADGGEFGMGAEIGISTGKLHARGPVGLEQLTSYKYIVRGDGQVRP